MNPISNPHAVKLARAYADLADVIALMGGVDPDAPMASSLHAAHYHLGSALHDMLDAHPTTHCLVDKE